MKKKALKFAAVTAAFIALLGYTQTELSKNRLYVKDGINSETVEFEGAGSLTLSAFDTRYDLQAESLDVNSLDYSGVTEIASEDEWYSYISDCIEKNYRYMFFKAPSDMSFNLDMVMKTNEITAITIYTIPAGSDGYTVTGYNFTYTYSHDILNAVKNGTTASLDSKKQAALSAAQSFVSEISERSAYEKEIAIHNFVCAKITYTNDTSNSDIINCYGGLVQGQGNCQAYTDSFNLLCGLAGLTTGRITCTASGVEHSLNYILLDGQHYFVDCTFDDGVSDLERGYGLFYFNLPYSVISADHDIDYMTFTTGESLDANNYYVKNGLYTDSPDGLKQLYLSLASAGKTSGEILFSDKNGTAALTDIFSENPCGYTNISVQKFTFGSYQVIKYELS